MAKIKKNLSLDEDIVRIGEEIVKNKVQYNDFSNLVHNLILKEYAKIKREK